MKIKIKLLLLFLLTINSLFSQDSNLVKIKYDSRNLEIYSLIKDSIGINCHAPLLHSLEEILPTLDTNNINIVFFHCNFEKPFHSGEYYHLKFNSNYEYILNGRAVSLSFLDKKNYKTDKSQFDLFNYPSDSSSFFYFKVPPITWEVEKEIPIPCKNEGFFLFKGNKLKYGLLSTGFTNIIEVADMCYELQNPIISQHYINFLKLINYENLIFDELMNEPRN